MQDASSNGSPGQKVPSETDAQGEVRPPSRISALFNNRLAIAGLVAVVAIAGGSYAYWRYFTLYPSTDNAYVQANIVQVAPLVTGLVTEVAVKEFASVKSGDVLLKFDPAPFDAALKAAEARLSLVQQQAGAAPAQSPAAKASVSQAQAAVDEARLELEHATIKAPVDGIVGKVLIRPGTIARAGVGLFPIVDNSKWWVAANFKETDLTRIEPGQKATISIDLFPSHEFAGEVEAISPASAAAFSLLPAENATGSWVKVTQRFPVRVSLTLQPGDPSMRLGASASVTVDTTSSKGSNGAAR
jgi:membrane fusion protein (multidrug efflux system)